MWTAIACVLGFGALLGAVVALARSGGSNAARLDALKEAIKREKIEREKTDKIMDGVNSLTERDVRQRLHHIANKK